MLRCCRCHLYVKARIGSEHSFLSAAKGVTFKQNAKIVVKYLDDHPERMNNDFTLLVVSAFDQAWPCPNAD